MASEYWMIHGALDQIAAEKAVIIADLGLGSDAPIVLNYAVDPSNPPVFRLRWGSDGRTAWVQAAREFGEFAEMLGLTRGVA